MCTSSLQAPLRSSSWTMTTSTFSNLQQPPKPQSKTALGCQVRERLISSAMNQLELSNIEQCLCKRLPPPVRPVKATVCQLSKSLTCWRLRSRNSPCRQQRQRLQQIHLQHCLSTAKFPLHQRRLPRCQTILPCMPCRSPSFHHSTSRDQLSRKHCRGHLLTTQPFLFKKAQGRLHLP